MKILLSLSALALLSTLFLISRPLDLSEPVRVVGIDLQSRAEDQGASNATFAGVTVSGDEIVLRTTAARPSAEDPRLILAEDVSARLDLRGGTRIDISARAGKIDQKNNAASLSGDVRVLTSDGYRVEADRIEARFDTLHADTMGPVRGKAPAGRIEAGRLVISSDAESGRAHLLFSNGVKLIYQPLKPKE